MSFLDKFRRTKKKPVLRPEGWVDPSAQNTLDKRAGVNGIAASRIAAAKQRENHLQPTATGRLTDVDSEGNPTSRVNASVNVGDMANARETQNSLKQQRLSKGVGNYMDRRDMSWEERKRLNADKYGPGVTPDEIRAAEASLDADMQAGFDKRQWDAHSAAYERDISLVDSDYANWERRFNKWASLTDEEQAEYRLKVKARRQQNAIQYRQGIYDKSGGRFGKNYRPAPEKPKTPEEQKADIEERKMALNEQKHAASLKAAELARNDSMAADKAKAAKDQAEAVRAGRSPVSEEVLTAVTRKITKLQGAAMSDDLGDAGPVLAERVFNHLDSVANPAGQKILRKDYDDARRNGTFTRFIAQANPETYAFAEEPEKASVGGRDDLGNRPQDWVEKATAILTGDPNDADTAILGDNPDEFQLAKRLREGYRKFVEMGKVSGTDDEVIRRAFGAALLEQEHGEHLKVVWETLQQVFPASREPGASGTEQQAGVLGGSQPVMRRDPKATEARIAKLRPVSSNGLSQIPPSTEQQAMVAAIAQAKKEGVQGRVETIARAREIMAEGGR